MVAKAAAASKKARTSASAEKSAPLGAKLVKTVSGVDARCAVVVNDCVWTASRDGDICIRDVETAEVVDTIETHVVVSCLAKVNQQVWAGSEKGPILIFDARKGSRRLLREARQHAGGVHCLEWDGAHRVWSGSADFMCIEWSARDGSFIRWLSGHGGGVKCLLAVGTKYLWSGCDDNLVRVWDQDSGKLISELSGHTDSVLGLALATTTASGAPAAWGDSSGISSGAGDGSGSGSPALSPTRNPFGLRDEQVALEVTSRMEGLGLPNITTSVWSCSADGTIRAWNSAHPFNMLRTADTGARVVNLAAMGSEMWSSGQTGTVSMWEPKTMALKGTMKGHDGFTTDLLRVKKEETQSLWSVSMSDNTLNVYSRRAHEDFEPTELLAAAGAANAALAAAAQHANSEMKAKESALAALVERDATIEELTSDLSDARKSIADLEPDSAAAPVLRKQLAEVRSQLEVERTARARAEEEASSLRGDVLQAQDRISALEARPMTAPEHVIAELVKVKEDLANSEEALARSQSMQAIYRDQKDRLTAQVGDQSAEIDRVTEALDKELKGHADTHRQLREECELSIKLQQRLQQLDPTAFKQKLASHELAVRTSAAHAELLETELEQSRKRESELKKRMRELDIFSLDNIARALGDLESEMVRIRTRVNTFTEGSHMANPDDRAKLGRFTTDVSGRLANARARVKSVIAECLSETQKFHIGTATRHSAEAADGSDSRDDGDDDDGGGDGGAAAAHDHASASAGQSSSAAGGGKPKLLRPGSSRRMRGAGKATSGAATGEHAA